MLAAVDGDDVTAVDHVGALDPWSDALDQFFVLKMMQRI